MKYNKRQIMLRAWELKKTQNTNYTLSSALKIAWKEAKTKANNFIIDKVYRENINTIKKVCWWHSVHFKIEYEDILSKANEIFIKIYYKYTNNKISFNKFLYISLNNYLKVFCKKEILRRKREEFIYFQNTPIEEIKNDKVKELSNLSKEILNYCLEENTKKEMNYQKTVYKDKIYTYPIKIKKISTGSIFKYFKKFYRPIEIKEAFKEIKFILREEAI